MLGCVEPVVLSSDMIQQQISADSSVIVVNLIHIHREITLQHPHSVSKGVKRAGVMIPHMMDDNMQFSTVVSF